MADKPTNMIDTLSANLRRQIGQVKPQINRIADRFGVLRENIKEIAPRVVRLFNACQNENERITFVDFARMFDPSVPTHASDKNGVPGYRNHKVYYTLTYMRRTLQLKPTGRQGVRDNATDGLARAIATILQVVNEPERVWQAVQVEFAFGERLMTNLRKRVENTKPLFSLEIKRPVGVGKVIHMTPIQREAASGVSGAQVTAEVTEAPRRGRPRKVAA